MKFSSVLGKNVKIKLAREASQFLVNDEFFFIKHDNRLFKINVRSNDKRLRILHILKQPKKLVEIIDLLSEFKKKDVIDFLERLHALNLLKFEDTDVDKNIISDVISKKVDFARHHVKSRDMRRSYSSQILLIGDGNLAKNLFAYLKDIGINCNKMTTSPLMDKTAEKKKIELMAPYHHLHSILV